ncbi:hypothetical protein MBLNU457_g0214t2 [Dothideomycetes sp. NU457]
MWTLPSTITPLAVFLDLLLTYLVDSLPDVSFDVGELYSGQIPINYTNTNRALFFMFKPTISEPVDEITIWLNGGPGCSSLEGFLQENGPWIWQPGTYAPIENPYSWVNLTNMLWVEFPVGVGFSTGIPLATTQEETAKDFINFFKNFETLFGIKNFKIYVTGESYAGRYVPYISAAMLDQNDTEYFNVSGALAYDPVIGNFVYSANEAVVVPFAIENNNILNLNATFLSQMESLHESCDYADYVNTYLQFPAPANASCDVFGMINEALLAVNPCFDIYEIVRTCPLLWDVLSMPTELAYTPAGATTYFNRTDVKTAIHAPLDRTWTECSAEAVYRGGPIVNHQVEGGPEMEGDWSADPIQRVLPQVIEATNRVLIGNGQWDMVIITNGTLLSIQNMTWNGGLGFQEQPSTPIDISTPDLMYRSAFDQHGLTGVDGAQGIMGIQHYERGLMFVETFQCGHMQPEFQPRVSYRHLEWVLGRIDTI